MEPDWNDGCVDKKPGDECADCLYQRKYFGYKLVNGTWVKEVK